MKILLLLLHLTTLHCKAEPTAPSIGANYGIDLLKVGMSPFVAGTLAAVSVVVSDETSAD